MKNRKHILLILFALIVFAARYYFALPKIDKNFVGFFQEQYVTLTGQIGEEPENELSTNQVPIEVNGIKQFGNRYPVSGVILARFSDDGSVHYGDIVEISGELLKPNNGDPRIAGLIKQPTIKVIQADRGNFLLRNLFRFKELLISRLEKLLPEPTGSFAGALLLGARSAIPQEVIQDFRHTGLTHIIALSGFNIIILIEFISIIFSVFPRKFSNIFSVIVITLFTLLVGASASVVRAATMGSLGLIARIFGRKVVGIRTLFITGYAMALIDPFIVVYDIGFQLSFGATAGIMLFAKKWQEYFEYLPNKFGIREGLVTTWSAQVFTTPLIIWYFSGFSIITPLANILVLPAIPLLMLGSGLSIVFGQIIAAPTWILFTIVLSIIHFFASLPVSFIDFGMS